MEDTERAVAAFWVWWRESGRAEAVAGIEGAGVDDAFVETIGRRLDAVAAGLAWEPAPGREAQHALVVSAGGDPELRAVAHRVIRAASAERRSSRSTSRCSTPTPPCGCRSTAPARTGWPESDALDRLREREDEPRGALGGEAFLAAHETADGARTFHLYFDSTAGTEERLREHAGRGLPGAEIAVARSGVGRGAAVSLN